MQFVAHMRAGLHDPHTAVHKLERLQGVSKAVLISNPYDILVIIDAPSVVEANRFLEEVDMFEDVQIAEVLYDPVDHPDMVFEVPSWDREYPKLKPARQPLIDSVPDVVSNRHGRVYTNSSSQAGLAAMSHFGAGVVHLD